MVILLEVQKKGKAPTTNHYTVKLSLSPLTIAYRSHGYLSISEQVNEGYSRPYSVLTLSFPISQIFFTRAVKIDQAANL